VVAKNPDFWQRCSETMKILENAVTIAQFFQDDIGTQSITTIQSILQSLLQKMEEQHIAAKEYFDKQMDQIKKTRTKIDQKAALESDEFEKGQQAAKLNMISEFNCAFCASSHTTDAMEEGTHRRSQTSDTHERGHVLPLKTSESSSHYANPKGSSDKPVIFKEIRHESRSPVQGDQQKPHDSNRNA